VRDPHVKSLTFQLKTDGSIIFKDAPPLIFATSEFDGRLEGDELVVSMVEHYRSEEDARLAVEPYLRSWETNTLLDGNRLKFVFVCGDVIDRNPQPAGEHRIIEARGHSSSTATVSATAVIIKSLYPPPPTIFNRSPLVVAMVDRLEQYLKGGESLFTAAYYCVTAIERSADPSEEGSARKKAAAKYRIDLDVLKQLGTLSSERGSALEARKFGRPLPTDAERQWLEAAIGRLIRQIAAVDGGDEKAYLSMGDLPLLTP